MVITRLSRCISYNKGIHEYLGVFASKITRRTVSTSQNEDKALANQEVVNTESPPQKLAKTKIKFSDLPEVYITSSGAPAKPLEPFFSDDQEVEDQIPIDPPPKPVRKRRSKNTIQPSEAAELDEGPQEAVPKKTKVPKAPKPATFLSRQILSNLKRFPHCLLLTRVGQFYESYFDQAVEISHLLNIKLTSRKWNGGRVAMCGFPLLHLDRHLKTLVQKERRFVALCEEFPVRANTYTTAKEFERRIARIVTPGTLIDESFLNPAENNYLLAISPEKDPNDCASQPEVGLAWIDVSTGEFFSKECKLENIPDELARLAPREVVLDDTLRKRTDHPVFPVLGEGNFLVSYTSTQSSAKPPEFSASDLDLEKVAYPSTEPPIISSLRESSAINLLTKFLQDNLLEHMPRLDAPLHESSQDRMQIDLHTIQGLEIRESGYEASAKGSLLSVVKRTTTSGGARLLARWLCSPSTSIPELNHRQSLVAFFRGRPHFCADMREILNEIDDVGRLCQRFLLGRADFGDLISIRTSIQFWKSLKNLCEQEKNTENIEHPGKVRADEWSSIESLLLRLVDLENLSERISKAVNLDGTNDIENNDMDDNEDVVRDDEDASELDPLEIGRNDTRKWSINPNFSEKLANLNDTLRHLLSDKKKMETNLRDKYRAPSLTLRSSSGQGMFVHLARAKRDKKKLDLDADFYAIGESLTTKSYIYRDWSQLGTKISETSSAISQAEKAVFDELSLEVIEHSHQLRQNAQVIDELDVTISFAVLADEMKFVRPELSEDGSYHVVNGRHPSVEMGLLSSGRQFTPNSVIMTPTSNVHIITGPNMAGKSTLLRQTAIIAILAQVGSCVPADFAHISIVDKLFSRIGAKDDLFRDRSTFMVEMIETADILRRATDKSLVIMDEVGRGTTVKDGLAIAFAALHHLATVNGGRCLFATHFHELAEMVGNTDNTRGAGIFHNVRFYCSDVDDAGDGHFTYSYRLRPGVNRDSHGLKVARLAGIPSSTMDVATHTLSWLRENGSSNIQNDYNNFLESTLKSTL